LTTTYREHDAFDAGRRASLSEATEAELVGELARRGRLLLEQSGSAAPQSAQQIVLHERGRCVGVVADGHIYTHNFKLSWPRPGWAPVAEEAVAERLRQFLARARANAAQGFVP
jgi:hypothetical protein